MLGKHKKRLFYLPDISLVLRELLYLRKMSQRKFSQYEKSILAQSATSPLDSKREMPTSTAFSALKRLSKQGYVIKNKKYEIDDPFFARWIFNRSL